MTDTEKTALKEKCDLQFPGGGDNMPCKSTWENTRVGQEEGEGKAWAEAFIVVSRNAKVRQGKHVRIG